MKPRTIAIKAMYVGDGRAHLNYITDSIILHHRPLYCLSGDRADSAGKAVRISR
jgi:hypothetical protein